MNRFRSIRILLATLLLTTGVLFAIDPIEHLKGTPNQPVTQDDAARGESANGGSVTETVPEQPAEGQLQESGPVSVYVIPISSIISRPNEFILRRGIKEAIAQNIDVLVLDINTPGGRVDVMLRIMDKVSRFNGLTIAYVNNEAISAGAFISFAATEIWYAPNGVIGSAAVIQGTGEEIPVTMRQKIESYILAKTRAVGTEHPHRARVMRAMMDANYVLEIDGQVIKPAGELLTLTAREALREYGTPPTPLFGNGIAEDLNDLLTQRFGAGNFEYRRFEVTWSEELAKYMDAIAPLLIGLGFLALFIEFKTPGFGLFGSIGLVLIAIVFSTNYVVGLAGYEIILFFVLGVALVLVELFLFPGTGIFLIAGLALMFGSLLWSLADLWPSDGGGVEFDVTAFAGPLLELSLGLLVTGIGIIIVWKLLPESALLKRVVLTTASASIPPVAAHGGSYGNSQLPDLGSKAVVVSPLRPVGYIEVAGERFEAATVGGFIDKGDTVIITAYKNFHLVVEKAHS